MAHQPLFSSLRARPTAALALTLATLASACASVGSPEEQDGVAVAAPTPAPVAKVDAASTAKYSAQDEAVYLTRFNKLLEDARVGAGLNSYDPLEPVAGAANAMALPVAGTSGLSPEAITQSIAYVSARNTSAFIVWKDGEIHASAYGEGFDKTTPIVSKSLAKPVTALLIGRALMQGHITSLDQPVSDFITEWKRR